MKALTERQQQVLDFIRDYTKQNVCPPTVREIAEYFSFSLRAAQDHIAALQKKGFLSLSEKRSRSIKIIQQEDEQQLVRIPLLGTVAAGKPLLSEENFEGYVKIADTLLHRNKIYFALHVRGDSMIEAGILDGDLAVIERCATAENGTIVVAVVDDAITLKRFYREPTRFRLQPENRQYNPIYCQDLRIVGILSNIIRSY
jgi:repressor LexA